MFGTRKYTYRYFIVFVLILIACIFESIGFDYKAYNAEEWGRISIVGLAIITLILPSKYQVIIIGTVLGLSLSYLTYKYVVPLLLTLL